jgi:O-antigen ligase
MNTKLQKAYTYLAAAVCVSIPFMTYAKAFVNVTMICLLGILILGFKKDKIIALLNQRYVKIFFVFLIFVILFSLFNQSFFNDLSETRKIAQTLLLLILFSQVKNKEVLIYSFIAGTFISTFITDINIINYYLNSFEFLISGGAVKDLFITQRLYLGFFIIISIILLLERYGKTSNRKVKYIYLLLFVFFLISLFLIASRSAIAIAFLTLTTSIIYNIKNKYRIGFLLTMSIVFLAIIFNSKTLSKRFLYSDDSIRPSFIEKIKTHEPRYDIWKFSTQIFKEEKPYVFGIGTFRTQELLVSKYQLMPIEKRKNWFMERNFNTHNQYLDILISFGLIGLFVFLFLLKEIIVLCYKNIYSANLILSLVLFLLIENVFHRQLGSFIFALTLAIAVFIINSENEKNISS